MSMLMTLPKAGEHSKTPLHQAAHKGQGADASAFMAAPNGARVRGRWHRHGDEYIFFIIILFYFFLCLSFMYSRKTRMNEATQPAVAAAFQELLERGLRSAASVSTQELACGSPRERGAGKHPLFFPPRAGEYLRSDKLRAERGRRIIMRSARSCAAFVPLPADTAVPLKEVGGSADARRRCRRREGQSSSALEAQNVSAQKRIFQYKEEPSLEGDTGLQNDAAVFFCS